MNHKQRWYSGLVFGSLTLCLLPWLSDNAHAGGSIGWDRVHEQTACEATKPQACKGLYGITVDHQGQFAIGPGPNGEVLDGVVSADELARLDQDAGAVANQFWDTACETTSPLPGVNDTVGLMLADSQIANVYEFIGTRGQICYHGDRGDAFQLQADLNALMKKYYPTPFPAGG